MTSSGMPVRLGDKLLAWASVLDDNTIDQALMASRLPIVPTHVALMPDAHLGIGATVGSVIPTEGAVIPSAVGVDIGCGMIAVETSLTASTLPDDLESYLVRLNEVMPAGLGKWHATVSPAAERWFASNPCPVPLTPKQEHTVVVQFGTLGSGNHFFEVCLDERDTAWVVLHSGSRGIGNQLAQQHITKAKQLAKAAGTPLEDPDLAYYLEGTEKFEEYIGAMLWSQAYAFANRAAMMDAAVAELLLPARGGREVDRINSHHNFAVREHHDGRDLWITRKGAVRAERGDRGVIPGSMGTKTFIVRGLGNPLSYNSCAHGAGRRMSRTAARKQISLDELSTAMEGRVWLQGSAERLIDEAPAAYKDIEQVMRDQADLVEVEHELRQVLNYKGV
ncbi:MAG TPA: RtcB family protein [Actinomycetota bacterium]|nr:RtcB family protein [Actinomycetota bacterium]